MDIKSADQRILHLMAQGGWIEHRREGAGKVTRVICFSRDGWVAPGLDLTVFRRLKRLKAIASQGGKPYRITTRGLLLVRSQQDNC